VLLNLFKYNDEGVPHLAQHESTVPVKTVGMQLDFDGFLYQSVSLSCTHGKNGGLIKVNFVNEFYAMFHDSRFLWLLLFYAMFMLFAPGCYGVPCLSYIHFATLKRDAGRGNFDHV
jgi:hypothetical protein